MFALHLRGGGAFFVDVPQSKQFGPGGDLALSGEYAFLPQIGIEVLAGLQRFGAADGSGAGSEFRVGAGIRVRPWNDQKGYLLHDRESWDAVEREIAESGTPVAFRTVNPGFIDAVYIDAPELGHYLEYIYPEAAGVQFFEAIPAN